VGNGLNGVHTNKRTETVTISHFSLILQFGANNVRSLEGAIHVMTAPCLVHLGEGDGKDSGAKKSARTMSNATCVCSSGLDHIEVLFRSDLVLPHITKFLKKATQR
jgi:hypothetical protein